MRIQLSRRTSILVAVALTVVLDFGGAEGQTIPSAYRFVDAGHTTGVIAGVMQEARGSVGIGPSGGAFFGGRYALEFRGPLAVEATAFVMPTDREVLRPISGQGLVPIGTADMLMMGIDGRLRFSLTGSRTWHGMVPLLMVGGGVVNDFSSPSELEMDLPVTQRLKFGPSFLVLIGGGVQWIPGERFEFRLDTTLNIWKLDTPTGFAEVEGEADGLVDEQWTGVGAFILGATYRF